MTTNPFHVNIYDGRKCYACTAYDQLSEVKNMGIDKLKQAIEFEGTKPSVKKAAASRLRRLTQEAGK